MKTSLNFFIIFFFLTFFNKSVYANVTYNEILDNPTDLELNLNYAKQQERAGNIKSTISTLERLSILYPKNSDIKLYLLSILLKMDSKIKVDFMVKTMLNDPNTSDETKNLIAELLSDKKFEDKKKTRWIAYVDLKYSQTEENNISGRTKSGKLAKSNGTTDSEVPFPTNDSRLTLGYDKTFARSTSLTLGKILSDSSSTVSYTHLTLPTSG